MRYRLLLDFPDDDERVNCSAVGASAYRIEKEIRAPEGIEVRLTLKADVAMAFVDVRSVDVVMPIFGGAKHLFVDLDMKVVGIRLITHEAWERLREGEGS